MLVWKQASLSPPGTLRAVIPGSWLRKKKKEDEGVTSLASPFRQQEKKNGFQININILFYKLNNVSLRFSATLSASVTV